MATLPHAGAAQRAGRRDGQRRRPGQDLLVGPIPATLSVRIRLHHPTHDPLASHLSLLTGGTQLGPSSPAWTAPAAPTETSSGAGANGEPGRICHLRLGHLTGPARLDGGGQTPQRGPRRQVAEVVFLLATVAPFADQPDRLARQADAVGVARAVGDAYPHGGEAGTERSLGATSPGDAPPALLVERLG